MYLEIDDKETLKNIISLPHCKEWNLLKVEDKGLLVPHEYKSKVIEVMNTFGFHLKEVQIINEGKDYFPPSIELEPELPSKIPNYIEKKPNTLKYHCLIA